jgi:hypothetical protein
MTVLRLPRVTLCCVDSTPRLAWSLKALRHCLAQVAWGDAFLCTDRASLAGHAVPDGVRWVEIAPLDSIESYSEFMLKGLAPHLRTSHLLVVQWDGYVLNPVAWRDEFLSVDYIGAPWNHVPQPWKVGNGGFSLRSAALLQALQDPSIRAEHPEDLCICKTNRAALEAKGLRFAPLAMAERFAVEDGPLSAEVFGFHGPYHLPSLLPPGEVLAFVESLPTRALRAHYFGSLLRELVRGARRDPALRPALAAFRQLVLRAIDEFDDAASLSPQALGMLKALIRHGPHDGAARLLARRRAASGRRFGEPKLWLRLQFNALRSAVLAR